MTCTIGTKRQILISAILYLGEIILGYMISWSGPIIPKLQNLKESPLPYLLTETQISLVGSVAYIGAIPGLYVIGWLSNYKGRKPCFVMCGIIAIIAFTVLSLTRTIAMLYCGRLLNACSVALISSLNILYIGEVVSTNIRGSFLAALGIFKSVGSILLFSTAPFFSYYVSAYIGVALSVLYTVAVSSIPESPLFFVLKDKEDKAVNNLVKLGRMDEKDKLLDTKKEFKSTNDKMDWIELFKLRTNKKALFLVIILNTLQQCSGGMTILFFSGTIFEMAGSMINSNISMITIGCIQLIGSILSPILVSRTGTKKLLLISTFVCSVTMFLMGLYFYLQYLEVSGINQVQWLPLAIFTIHFIGYECGFGILPLTLIGEMFTINVRSKGSAVVLSIAWVFGFLVSTAFGSVVKSFGVYVMFWFFSFSSVCAFVFTIFCIPETKGKSLLEIQQFLGKKNRR